MKIIGSRLRGDVDIGACGAAVFRAVVAGLHVELLDRIQAAGEQPGAALEAIGHVRLVDARGVNAVDRELVVNGV